MDIFFDDHADMDAKTLKLVTNTNRIRIPKNDIGTTLGGDGCGLCRCK